MATRPTARPPAPGRARRLTATPLAGAGLAAALAVVLAGCGVPADEAVTGALEAVTEQATGLRIDEDDGTVAVEGDDFSLSFDTSALGRSDDEGTGADGEDRDGGEDGVDRFVHRRVTEPAGQPPPAPIAGPLGPAVVPEGFPVPLPDGGVVEVGARVAGSATDLLHVGVRYRSGELGRIVAHFDEHFAADAGLDRRELDQGGRASVAWVTNRGGLATAVTVVDQPWGPLLVVEAMVRTGDLSGDT